MDANDNARYLNDRIVQMFFASRLAPAGGALRWFSKAKKRASKLFDGEEVEP